MEWRRRMNTEMEWRQCNDSFPIMKKTMLPLVETEMEWRQINDPFCVMRTSPMPPKET